MPSSTLHALPAQLPANPYRFLMQNNLPGSGILDAVVFNKVKAATGGRLRFCMSGAAVR